MSSSSIVVIQKGLRNLGQTCYLNAIVQILSYSQFIRNHMLRINLIKENTNEKTIFELFQDLIRDLQNPNDGRTILTPSGFRDKMHSSLSGIYLLKCRSNTFDS
jgi:ubiquitin C-terminal hydrolase